MFAYLLKIQFRRAGRYFRQKKAAKIITSFLFLAVLALLSVGIYFFFAEGFAYVASEDEILDSLLLYFYEIFFLFLGAIIFFSSLVTGMFSLWRGKNDGFLMASPAFSYLPKLVFVKTFLNGLWPLFVVLLPVVLAANKVFGLSLFAIFFILISFFFYLALISVLALLMISLSAFLLDRFSSRASFLRLSFSKLFFFILPLILIFAFFVWNRSVKIDFIELFRAYNPKPLSVSIERVAENYLYLPSHLPAMEAIYWQTGRSTEALLYFSYLFVLTFISLAFWWKISSRFLPLWQRIQEGSGPQAEIKKTHSKKKKSWLFSGGAPGALFKKELLVGLRNPRNMMWFSFLIFIWLMEAAISLSLGRSISNYELDPSFRQTAIQALQFVISTYFISAFVLRFVFPSFSSEKRTFWILESAPIDFKKIFYAKYAFYSVFFLVLGSTLAYLNLFPLKLAWVYIGEMIFLFSVATLFICALGLSMGALFPNYDTDDPGAASTTLPGISLIIISLLYGSIGGGVIYISQQSLSAFWIYIFSLISIAAIVAMLYLVPRMVKSSNRAKRVVS